MNRIATLFALGCLAISMMPGCDVGSSGKVEAKQLQLTPEEAAAIKQQDDQVADEEGGPAKQTKAKKGGAAKR